MVDRIKRAKRIWPDLSCTMYSLKFRRPAQGHRFGISFEDWETTLIRCAEEMGCEKGLCTHRMGPRF
jgi:hypothetical protein